MREVTITISGRAHRLTREGVIGALRDADPERLQRLGVEVEGRLFPVKQAFERVTGLGRQDFISHQACRAFGNLGFRVIGYPRVGATPGIVPSAPTGGSGAMPERSSSPNLEAYRLLQVRSEVEKALLQLHPEEMERLLAHLSIAAEYWTPLNDAGRASALAQHLLEPLLMRRAEG